MNPIKRRNFLTKLAMLPAISSHSINDSKKILSKKSEKIKTKNRLKLSLNAFSFNGPLSNGTMNIDDMLEFCAAQNFDGVDITAYYFPGYPQVPENDYLYHVKKKAFRLGLEISGTGVRNDFTLADKAKRQESVDLVKNWIVAAEKFGAPVIRIFAGHGVPKGYTREQVLDWMVEDIESCVDFGKRHGVMVAVQNHHDFILTAAHVQEIMDRIPDEWFGLILDTGSYRTHDPYEEIAASIQYAVNWQIKEKIFIEGREVDTDLPKLVKIIKDSDYNGYLPIETLGEGDPNEKVKALLGKLKSALQEV